MRPAEGLLESAIADGVFPGACYAFWRDGELEMGAVGSLTYELESLPVTLDTQWDLASLSKVIGTTTAVMILVQEGKLDLDQPVCELIHEFRVNGKEHITFRNLMVHNSGLVAFRPYHLTCTEPSEVMNSIYGEELEVETGADTVYSDLSMILVGESIELISGQGLDEFLWERVFEPLGMRSTGYFGSSPGEASRSQPLPVRSSPFGRFASLPSGRVTRQSFLTDTRGGICVERARCAPTEEVEEWRRTLRIRRCGEEGARRLFGENPLYIQGEVHDPTAAVLGGVAGHAGLFSTIGDLVRFMTHFQNSSEQIVRSDVWCEFTKRQNSQSTRALGWDTKSEIGSSAGPSLGSNSFGHTGYTGTSVWCDPGVRKVAILLTNRVCPTSKNTKILGFRPKFNEFC